MMSTNLIYILLIVTTCVNSKVNGLGHETWYKFCGNGNEKRCDDDENCVHGLVCYPKNSPCSIGARCWNEHEVCMKPNNECSPLGPCTTNSGCPYKRKCKYSKYLGYKVCQ
ncbi:uncharacterized protein LOC144362806 [Saccoglossus kowalevskii]